MSENVTIVDAVDSFVASLKNEEKSGKLLEDNHTIVKDKNETDNNMMGLDNIAGIIKRTVEMICLGEEVRVNADAQEYKISVQGEDLGIAIGREGKNMAAIEYLVNLISRRKKLVDRKVTLDIMDYRKMKIDKITRTAINMAKKAIKEGRNITLRPMGAYERKIIHNALSKFKDISTRSRDEEPNRRIIIYPLKEAK